MKIYTKKGDEGNTSLFGGTRVPKSSARIEAYGTVDELNSVVGITTGYPLSKQGEKWLRKIQEDLLVLGTDLATPPSSKTRIQRVDEDAITFLEQAIDMMEDELPALKNFILPGGSHQGATLHLARTVCRRAERAAVRCSKSEEISALAIKYLNRLSDFLFVLARFENKHAGMPEDIWKPERQ